MVTPLLPIPILPDSQSENQSENQQDDWGQQQKGFFSINVTDVRQKLALRKYLAPEGIASPWAQLYFVNWMLEDQESNAGREAVQALKVIVLLQFLGYLEACSISLTGDDDLEWLGQLLAQSEGTRQLRSLILWKIRGLHPDWDNQIFAGSHPANPFFPGAAFYPDLDPDDPNHLPAWCRVKRALISVRGPHTVAPLLDEKGEVVSPHLAASLSRYLNSFIHAVPISGWKTALSMWREGLTALAQEYNGQVIPVAWSNVAVQITSQTGDTISVPVGIYPLGTSILDSERNDLWLCPQCEQAGDSWINVDGDRQQAVTSTKQEVVCPRHQVRLQTVAGEPISPIHYGAYPAPDGTLYVWIDPLARPIGCTQAEIQGMPGSDGKVIYWFNMQSLEVRGRLVSLETVLLKNVAWMSRKERDDPSPVDVPVSGADAVLVDRCERDPHNRQWKIHFFGLCRPVMHPYLSPHEGLWQDSTIIVWPPQDCPDWSIDYVAASTSLVGRAGFRLVEKRTDNVLVRSPVFHTLALYRTKEGKARYVEVGDGLTPESFQSLGLLEVKRPEVRQTVPGGRGQLVLDFGTSNSAILTCLPGTDNPKFVWSGVLENQREDSAYYVTFKERDFNFLLDAFRILSTWNRETQSEYLRPFLPSLLAKPQPDQMGSEPAIPPRGRGLDQLVSLGPNSPILSGLKWQDWRAPGVEAQLKSMLELLLLPAFWELRANGCNVTDLRVTYPLAFDNTRRGIYRQVISEAVRALSAQTGLQVEPIILHSESAAGSNFLLQTAATHVVTLDLGGGTTDCAIHVGSAGQEVVGKTVGTILVADSFEYGGRDFLRAVVVAYGPDFIHQMLSRVEPSLLPQQSFPPNPTKPEEQTYQLIEAYANCLEALLHRRSPEGFLNFLRHVPENKEQEKMRLKYVHTLFRWEALLTGLLFYIRCIVEACLAEIPPERPVDVSFHLLGQGWDLLRILLTDMNNPAPVHAVMEPRFRTVCDEIAGTRGTPFNFSVHTLPTTQEVNPKTAVVLGARKLPQGGHIAALPMHAAAVDIRKTFVGMDIFDAQNALIIDQKTRLENVTRRPNWPRDPGYGKLLDELCKAIPEHIPGTQQPWRERVKNYLLDSTMYKRQFGTADVRQHIIHSGQNDLNRDETWPPGSINPARSLLAGFLTSVWRPVWASIEL